MKPEKVRTTVDVPKPLRRKLKQPAHRRVQFPLIRSEGRKVPLSNEQIYEHVEFP